MSIAWIAPAALLGLAAIALPIAIHLLVRQHARTLAYPSLRFLRETQLAAFRRRTIQDAALLFCRVAIIALAAVALAGPVLQLASRTAGYASRTSRAIVPVGDGVDAPAGEDVFASATFTRANLGDALSDAIRWLDAQPPSAREIVIRGALRRGSISDAEVATIPPAIGVRFEPLPASSSNDVTWPVLTRRNGALVRLDRALHLESDATRVTDGAITQVPEDLVTIVARGADLPLAQASLRAALDAGVAWPDFTRRVIVAWDGADASTLNALATGTHVIRMPVPSPPSSAADAVMAALETVSPRPDALEPVMITPEQLAVWSRPPGPPAASGTLVDEGDRRWIWAAVLVLLALETWMRRSRAAVTDAAAVSETRVA